MTRHLSPKRHPTVRRTHRSPHQTASPDVQTWQYIQAMADSPSRHTESFFSHIARMSAARSPTSKAIRFRLRKKQKLSSLRWLLQCSGNCITDVISILQNIQQASADGSLQAATGSTGASIRAVPPAQEEGLDPTANVYEVVDEQGVCIAKIIHTPGNNSATLPQLDTAVRGVLSSCEVPLRWDEEGETSGLSGGTNCEAKARNCVSALPTSKSVLSIRKASAKCVSAKSVGNLTTQNSSLMEEPRSKTQDGFWTRYGSLNKSRSLLQNRFKAVQWHQNVKIHKFTSCQPDTNTDTRKEFVQNESCSDNVQKCKTENTKVDSGISTTVLVQQKHFNCLNNDCNKNIYNPKENTNLSSDINESKAQQSVNIESNQPQQNASSSRKVSKIPVIKSIFRGSSSQRSILKNNSESKRCVVQSVPAVSNETHFGRLARNTQRNASNGVRNKSPVRDVSPSNGSQTASVSISHIHLQHTSESKFAVHPSPTRIFSHSHINTFTKANNARRSISPKNVKSEKTLTNQPKCRIASQTNANKSTTKLINSSGAPPQKNSELRSMRRSPTRVFSQTMANKGSNGPSVQRNPTNDKLSPRRSPTRLFSSPYTKTSTSKPSNQNGASTQQNLETDKAPLRQRKAPVNSNTNNITKSNNFVGECDPKYLDSDKVKESESETPLPNLDIYFTKWTATCAHVASKTEITPERNVSTQEISQTCTSESSTKLCDTNNVSAPENESYSSAQFNPLTYGLSSNLSSNNSSQKGCISGSKTNTECSKTPAGESTQMFPYKPYNPKANLISYTSSIPHYLRSSRNSHGITTKPCKSSIITFFQTSTDTNSSRTFNFQTCHKNDLLHESVSHERTSAFQNMQPSNTLIRSQSSSSQLCASQKSSNTTLFATNSLSSFLPSISLTKSDSEGSNYESFDTSSTTSSDTVHLNSVLYRPIGKRIESDSLSESSSGESVLSEIPERSEPQPENIQVMEDDVTTDDPPELLPSRPSRRPLVGRPSIFNRRREIIAALRDIIASVVHPGCGDGGGGGDVLRAPLPTDEDLLAAPPPPPRTRRARSRAGGGRSAPGRYEGESSTAHQEDLDFAEDEQRALLQSLVDALRAEPRLAEAQGDAQGGGHPVAQGDGQDGEGGFHVVAQGDGQDGEGGFHVVAQGDGHDGEGGFHVVAEDDWQIVGEGVPQEAEGFRSDPQDIEPSVDDQKQDQVGAVASSEFELGGGQIPLNETQNEERPGMPEAMIAVTPPVRQSGSRDEYLRGINRVNVRNECSCQNCCRCALRWSVSRPNIQRAYRNGWQCSVNKGTFWEDTNKECISVSQDSICNGNGKWKSSCCLTDMSEGQRKCCCLGSFEQNCHAGCHKNMRSLAPNAAMVTARVSDGSAKSRRRTCWCKKAGGMSFNFRNEPQKLQKDQSGTVSKDMFGLGRRSVATLTEQGMMRGNNASEQGYCKTEFALRCIQYHTEYETRCENGLEEKYVWVRRNKSNSSLQIGSCAEGSSGGCLGMLSTPCCTREGQRPVGVMKAQPPPFATMDTTPPSRHGVFVRGPCSTWTCPITHLSKKSISTLDSGVHRQTAFKKTSCFDASMQTERDPIMNEKIFDSCHGPSPFIFHGSKFYTNVATQRCNGLQDDCKFFGGEWPWSQPRRRNQTHKKPPTTP